MTDISGTPADNAAATAADFCEEAICCPICLDLFDDPRTLSCRHTFCTRCLHLLPVLPPKRSVACPCCRRVTLLPPSGITGLPADDVVTRLLQASAEARGPPAAPDQDVTSSSTSSAPASPMSDPGPKAPDEAPQPRQMQFLWHPLRAEDTLTQLSLTYYTTVSTIKMLNNIYGNDLDLLPRDTVLLIPKDPRAAAPQPLAEAAPPRPEEKIKVLLLASKNRMSWDEAESYLHCNAWDVKKALAEWKEDVAWEDEAGGPQQKPKGPGVSLRKIFKA